MKSGVDSLDTMFLRWKGMLESVNTAEDSTFQQLNTGACRGRIAMRVAM